MAGTQPEKTQDSKDGVENATSPVVNLASGCVLTLMGLAGLFWLIPNHVDASAGSYDVSPAFMPNLAAWVVTLLGATLACSAALKCRAAHPVSNWPALVVPAIWGIASIAIYLGVTNIGFVYVMPLVVAAGLLLSGQRSWPTIVAIAVLFPLAIDLAAWHLFTVQLP
ncbi:MAG: tripartite tricarboxylate transporter TctB family protein [Rhizobiaceae bacterium]|nr:tripartite tricarboxylate transporter TctB family protein [Rhizobiaceae bacterium]